jgi:hypothetical protein
MFTLVLEKAGYLNKELHFDLAPCYSNVTWPPKPVTTPAPGTAKHDSTGQDTTTKTNSTTTTKIRNDSDQSQIGNLIGSNQEGTSVSPSIIPECSTTLSILLLIGFVYLKPMR